MNTHSSPSAPETTVGEFLQFLAPGCPPSSDPPSWPADVFAVAASLLLHSGAYLYAVSKWPPKTAPPVVTGGTTWSEDILDIGKRWRAISPGAVPKEIQSWWSVLRKHQHLALSSIVDEKDLCCALLQLCAAADEASDGVGYPFGADLFDYIGSAQLLPDPLTGSTLCREIHPSRVRVLPKCHTPQMGITLDSLAHNLTLYSSGDVVPQWYTTLQKDLSDRGHSFNLLIVPWPEFISPTQFSPATPQNGELDNMPESYGFFCFNKESNPKELISRLDSLHEKAIKTVGPIHMVVLPELALDPVEYDQVRLWARRKELLLLCGVGEAAKGNKPGRNYVALEAQLSARNYAQVKQTKHHRWRLERSQIVQYGLGGQLDPEVQWWEYATVEARRLTFVSLLDWLSFCFLVCEDLARQEPVARLVRAVGPNLVIALLMDGPQLASRWPGRYATVLADDPGSSVLTLTSIGMANLCRPPGVSPSRTVALWKDAKSGAARQIDLPLGAEGLVLNLTRRQEAEWSADGRSDEGATGYPILGGVHPIFLDRGKRTRKVSEKSKKNMMQEISPLDASILALLAQVPKEMGSDRRALFEETQRNLLHRLGNVAFEIGEAILDDTGRKFSLAAQATAGEMRRWAEANKAR